MHLQEVKEKIAELVEGVKVEVPIPCPDNKPGCLVYHFKTTFNPITLEYVVYAIDQHFAKQMELSKAEIPIIELWDKWQPFKTLDDQSPELIEWLWELLVNEK